MRNFYIFKLAKLLLASFVLLSSPSFAENEPRAVVVSGTGGTREIALNNAFRHAVEQAVGMIVTSESYVRNLKDIRDKVFVASNGFIEQYKVLTEESDVTGYAITIQAIVRQKKLEVAMSSATNTAITLDGASLMANQMLQEEKVKIYAEEIVVFLDDLIQNGFEYQYGAPTLRAESSISNTYYLVLPNFKIALKKDWLATLSKYRTKLIEKQSFIDALMLLDINGDIDSNVMAINFEAQDEEGAVIVSNDGCNNYYTFENCFNMKPKLGTLRFGRHIFDILGLHTKNSEFENFRYPNIPDKLRVFGWSYFGDGQVEIGPITLDSTARIKKIVIRAVKIGNYGGKLPLYKGNGVFE